eukprot:CAMPEP_0201988742 /NCGR_PEP_ID=MMETSP0904-20121228/92488_1 /ASSEMBLY_ACC=CAM_ASM_000553 /TAXON_ID=420261 /ORGANISM="Thalassiosira antarctica, Strain CCMP982" /LENGTH=89 /DNA_ID=CAMNT_0048542927 /DNA_START=79 /DNA_END=349 /DNA_ORIENTATION=-
MRPNPFDMTPRGGSGQWLHTQRPIYHRVVAAVLADAAIDPPQRTLRPDHSAMTTAATVSSIGYCEYVVNGKSEDDGVGGFVWLASVALW